MDLLSEDTCKKQIKQHKGATYISGIKYLKVDNQENTLAKIEKGYFKRTRRATCINQ